MNETAKKVIFSEEAREKLKEGVDIIADIVSETLGPNGKSIGLESSFGSPTITTNGSSIVKDIEIKDSSVNIGVSIAKEVAKKIKESSGDGTTTGIILLKSLVKRGIKNIASGASPIHIKNGIEKAVSVVIKEIDAISTPVESKESIEDIATVSASGNRKIGKMVADAIDRVGKDGVITIEDGKSTHTTLEIVEGMQFDRGYISPYFCTNSKQMTVELENANVLITDKKLSSIQELLPILQGASSSNIPLFIISEDIDGDVLSTLVVNKLRGSLRVACVKAPGFGDNRKAILEDIAILTGATVVSEDKGMKLTNFGMGFLGKIKNLTISKDKTTIISDLEKQDEINYRVKQIDLELKNAKTDYDKEKLRERKAKLKGGVAIIHVGAISDQDMNKEKQIFKTSLNSTRAAQKEGFVPGGGIALIRASKKLDDLKLTKEEQVGVKIVKDACYAPFKQIVKNSGVNSSLCLEEVMYKSSNFGFNAKSEKVEDLVACKIIDPTKVVKDSLIYAAASASMILLSEAIITDDKEDDEKSA